MLRTIKTETQLHNVYSQIHTYIYMYMYVSLSLSLALGVCVYIYNMYIGAYEVVTYIFCIHLHIVVFTRPWL